MPHTAAALGRPVEPRSTSEAPPRPLFAFHITINGQLAVKLVSPSFPRPPYEGRLQGIDLLKAAHASVPFVGRREFLGEFQAWCLHPRPVSFRVLATQGGAGKTRFAYELYSRMKSQSGWGAYFPRFLKDEAKEVDLWREIKLPNALLIADYASDYAKPLADLLRSLTESSPKPDRRIRILLMARTADWDQGWLNSLRSSRTGEEVDRLFHPPRTNPFGRLQFVPSANTPLSSCWKAPACARPAESAVERL